MVIGGVSILLLAADNLRRRKNSDSVLLFLWVFGVFVFATAVNWTVSGRNLLPMLPAVALLLIRRLEFAGLLRSPKTIWWLVPSWGGSLVIALLVTWADCQLANSARQTAVEMKQNLDPQAGTIWFEGHWGFQYYMEKLGGKAIDLDNVRLQSNDAIIVPVGNSFLFTVPAGRASPWLTYDSPVPTWLATMSSDAGAGYYDVGFGPLPFIFSRVPPDRYLVFRVK